MDIWSIEEVARTSDDVVVRRRFAQRNWIWLIVLLCIFTFVSILEASTGKNNTYTDVAIAVTNFAIAAFGLFFLRYATTHEPVDQTVTRRVGAWMRRNMNAVALAFVCTQYLLVIAFNRNTDEWFAWVGTMPLLTLGFRMLVSELVLLHTFLATTGLLMTFVFTPPKSLVPLLISTLVINTLALAIELFASSRMRKSVSSEWGSRRTQAREQLRMRDELRYARELQLSMLPECAPSLEWADICSISLPATEVGGDYYDYFVDGDRVALVCGDVAGHGMAAGLVLAALRSGFTLLRDSLSDPAVVLRRLHALVAETSRRRMLVTVSVVLLDRANRRATIASAGNPPVMLRRADGTVETIDLFAPPLGVRLPVDIPQRELPAGPGDTIVLHSDGIYETRNRHGEVYGLDRLAAVIRDMPDGGAESLRDAILRDVSNFRAGAEQEDDVTVVVCKLT